MAPLLFLSLVSMSCGFCRCKQVCVLISFNVGNLTSKACDFAMQKADNVATDIKQTFPKEWQAIIEIVVCDFLAIMAGLLM